MLYMGGRGYFCITNFFDKFRDLLNFFFARPSIDWMFLFFFYDVKKYHRVARKKTHPDLRRHYFSMYARFYYLFLSVLLF